eukprot:m51a1_g3864 putative sodium hydrogen exchanger 3 (604) ;mRNA; f:416916-419495
MAALYDLLESSLSSAFESAPDDEKQQHSYEVFLLALACMLLVAVLVCILFTTARALNWLHESIAVMALGVLSGIVGYFSLRGTLIPEVEDFSVMFYTLLFPPIIFNAGFTMKKRSFMTNLGSILTYAIAGTTLSSAAFGGLIYVMVTYGKGFGLSISFVECMLFGTLMSATDTVATIAHLLELNVHPMLYSLVFGESVLNDAVAITLYRALSKYYGKELSPIYLWYIARDCMLIIFGSFGIGFGIGALCAFIKARLKRFNLSPMYDISLLLLMAYISYLTAEVVKMSGVLALFICAVVMSHYCWYTISARARVALFTTAGTLDFVSQLVVFFCLGVFVFCRPNPWVLKEWNFLFIFVSIVLLFVGRAVNIFPLSAILNIGRRNKISMRYMGVMWWCGMRGVVTLLLAFGLKVANRQLFVNTTFVAIFFTNIFIGITTKPLVRKMNVGSVEQHANVLDPLEGSHPANESLLHGGAAKQEKSRLAFYWSKIDNRFLRPLLGGLADGPEKRRVEQTMKELDEAFQEDEQAAQEHALRGARGLSMSQFTPMMASAQPDDSDDDDDDEETGGVPIQSEAGDQYYAASPQQATPTFVFPRSGPAPAPSE